MLRSEDVIPGAPDEDILALAVEQDRVLITQDKGFGKLVYKDRLPHKGVVVFNALVSLEDRASLISELISVEKDAMSAGAYIVVSKPTFKVRIDTESEKRTVFLSPGHQR